jgi:uncharacterized protein (DUF305 family)
MKTLRLLALVALMLTTSVLTARADAPVEGRAGRAEVRFLEGMIDHHQMALDMANDCLKKAKSESVLALCQAVIDAQSAEIKTMQDWLLSWYQIKYTPVAMAMDDASHDMGHGGHAGEPVTDPAGMMGMMAGFNRLEGRDYELAWLESMIDHHDDAIHMSERMLKTAQHEDLKTLAEAIIADQTAEIAVMEGMITELGA